MSIGSVTEKTIAEMVQMRKIVLSQQQVQICSNAIATRRQISDVEMVNVFPNRGHATMWMIVGMAVMKRPQRDLCVFRSLAANRRTSTANRVVCAYTRYFSVMATTTVAMMPTVCPICPMKLGVQTGRVNHPSSNAPTTVVFRNNGCATNKTIAEIPLTRKIAEVRSRAAMASTNVLPVDIV